MSRHGSAAAERHPIASLNRRGRIAYGLRRQHGLSVIGWLLMIPAALIVLLILVIGFYEGRKAYWDAQVREMCAKDGGVTVSERVKLTQSEYRRLGGDQGIVPVPARSSARPNTPYVADRKITKIREWGPEVYRLETMFVRVADGKLLSRQIQYGRIGGDFPSPSHPSSYGCSEAGLRLNIERQTFEIMESAQ